MCLKQTLKYLDWYLRFNLVMRAEGCSPEQIELPPFWPPYWRLGCKAWRSCAQALYRGVKITVEEELQSEKQSDGDLKSTSNIVSILSSFLWKLFSSNTAWNKIIGYIAECYVEDSLSWWNARNKDSNPGGRKIICL